MKDRITHYVIICYLHDGSRMGFELKNVPRGPDALPAILRSLADSVEKGQGKPANERE